MAVDDQSHLEPHAFERCDGPHMIPMDEHCWRCNRPPDDEIHKTDNTLPSAA